MKLRHIGPLVMLM